MTIAEEKDNATIVQQHGPALPHRFPRSLPPAKLQHNKHRGDRTLKTSIVTLSLPAPMHNSPQHAEHTLRHSHRQATMHSARNPPVRHNSSPP
ncbi:hypothetical protein E2C01_054988 [Portunus trituberculatus]|uniref:Uncharacterized protein n=1 Tax=Portunus trituberculatus TaxID=210409 RepID=A0A5B7GVE8_PORTR|nr:hypothetical protein [Portunus trituberculatus]